MREFVSETGLSSGLAGQLTLWEALPMQLFYHDTDAPPLDGAGQGDRLRRLLKAAGHDLLDFAGRETAAGEVAAVVERSAGCAAETVDRGALAWAGRQGLPGLALEPEVSALSGAGRLRMRDRLSTADRVITFDPRSYGPLEDLLGEGGQLRCYLPFLDVGPYVAAARDAARHREALSRRLICPGDIPWLLAAGDMELGDGVACYRLLGLALSKLLHEPWILLVQGDGPARSDVEESLASLPRDRLRFLDPALAPRRPEVFSAADLFVWPAIGSACDLALLEAQAAGLPVLAEKNELTLNYVADGATGKLFLSGNFASLANQISFLLRHENFRESYRQEALKSTAEYFGLLRAAKDFNSVLEEVLAGR